MHIPEKHFKMIRYYGIYAKHHKHENRLRLFISKKRCFHILRNSWKMSISLSFHSHPLLYKCEHKFTLIHIHLDCIPFFLNLNLAVILLNHSHKPQHINFQLTEKLIINIFRFYTPSFFYTLFELISVISYFFKKRNFLYNKKSPSNHTIYSSIRETFLDYIKIL